MSWRSRFRVQKALCASVNRAKAVILFRINNFRSRVAILGQLQNHFKTFQNISILRVTDVERTLKGRLGNITPDM